MLVYLQLGISISLVVLLPVVCLGEEGIQLFHSGMPLDGEIQIFFFLYWTHTMNYYTYSVFIYFISYPKLDFMPGLKL